MNRELNGDKVSGGIKSSFGTMGVDWQERINYDRLRKERLERATREVNKQGLGALLCLRAPNIRYVSSTHTPKWSVGTTGARYALLIKTGEPVMFEAGDASFWTRKNAPWIKPENVKYSIYGFGSYGGVIGGDAQSFQTKKFANQIRNELKAQGVLDEPLGLDYYDPMVVKEFENAGITCNLKGVTAMTGAREIKTKDEVECLRIVCSIVETAFYKVKEALKPGVRELDLLGVAIKTCYDQGAEFVIGGWGTSGPQTCPSMRQTTDRRIRPGDGYILDIFDVSYNGYRSCYYRTFSCGKPSQEYKDAYARCLDWLRSGIKAVKLGATTKDIAEKWPDECEWWGYDTPDLAVMNNWAHGIGLGLYEPPVVSRIWSLDYPYPIKKGQTFAIETQEYTDEGKKWLRKGIPGKGQGVRIEEMLHVTDTGAEVLSKFPVDEITVCEF